MRLGLAVLAAAELVDQAVELTAAAVDEERGRRRADARADSTSNDELSRSRHNPGPYQRRIAGVARQSHTC